MRRLSYLIALSLSLVGVMGIGANARLQPTPLSPAFESAAEVLAASSLRSRIRMRVRPSRYRRGAFARGDCPEEVLAALKPVVPETDEAGKLPLYLTAADHPVFFIHAPSLPRAKGFLYVDIPDNPLRERQLYKVAFDLTDESGILGIRIPEAAPPLQEGSLYQWRIAVECSIDNTRPDVIIVRSAALEKVADREGTDEERLDYYLQEGIWQDTVELLAEKRYENPSAETDEDWAIMMEESGIPQFSETPIVHIVEGRFSGE